MNNSQGMQFDKMRPKVNSYALNSKQSDAMFAGNSLGSFHHKDNAAPRSYWDDLDDSLNDSVPNVKAGFQGELSPDQIYRADTPTSNVKNILNKEDDNLTKMLNKIYLAKC